MTDRGQTAIDYLIGIIIVLVTIATVFGFFPSIFEPFEDPVGGDQEVMADRMGDELIELSKLSNKERTLDNETLKDVLNDPDAYDLTQRAGMQEWRQWNVTITDGSQELIRGGDATRRGAEATSLRYVQLEGGSNCQNGCRMIIRVW